MEGGRESWRDSDEVVQSSEIVEVKSGQVGEARELDLRLNPTAGPFVVPCQGLALGRVCEC